MKKTKKQISDEERNYQAIKIILRAEDLNKKPFEISTSVNVQLFNENDEVQINNIINQDFEIGYLRSLGGVVMGEASELASA